VSHLNDHRLDAEPAPERALVHRSPQTVGLAGGDFSGFAIVGDMPVDQRGDDGASLVFDGAPLGRDMAILGAAEVELALAVDRPSAFVAVRLCDVAPSGAVARVTCGLLNLAHRAGHDTVRQVVPGERMTVRVKLNDASHVFAAGHRVRVAVSTAYWPLVWPSPAPVTLTLYSGVSILALPVREPDTADARPRPFDTPECAPRLKTTTLRPGRYERTIGHDLATGAVTYRIFNDGGLFDGAAETRIDDIDLALGHLIERSLTIHPDDPLCASHRILHDYTMARGDWRIRLVARARMWSDARAFHMTAELDAYEGDARVFSREWTSAIPRDGV
jgi:hypothetical protein